MCLWSVFLWRLMSSTEDKLYVQVEFEPTLRLFLYAVLAAISDTACCQFFRLQLLGSIEAAFDEFDDELEIFGLWR